MIINSYIYGVATSYDPDAQLFFNAESGAGVTLTTTQMNAVNQWVVDSKTAGIWTKMKAVYPVVGGTATAHKFNLKNPADTNAAFRLSFIGGWTHSSTGMLPNGTNAYADTFHQPASFFSLGFYSRTNIENNGVDIGLNTKSIFSKTSFQAAGSATMRIAGLTYATFTVPNSLGFVTGSRLNNSTFQGYKNGVLKVTISDAAFAFPGYNAYIGANNGSGTANSFSARECAFAYLSDGLTDLESQLLYQITEKYQVALSRNINTTQSFYYNSAYNNETNAFLFSTQITDTTTQVATNTLVSDLKTAGVFTKIKALYPMVGGTATTHKYNLINPQDTNAAFRLAFSGGGTHSANGYLPNGTNAWADTFLTPSTTLTLNSQHISFYSRTNSNGTEVEIGCNNNGNSPNTLLEIRTAGTTYASLSASGYTTYVDANSLGLYIGNRTASNVTNLFKNNTKVATTAIGSTTSPFYSIGIGALNSGTLRQYYTTKECAFASIGDGLSDLESQLFYQITEKYQVALGRNVNPTQTFYYNTAYNNETNAFLFSTQITDNTIQTATNTLVSDLKTANIFTKMKAIYPMVGGTATTHKFNLVNAQDTNAAFRLAFVGGWTHSANGALPNGTNAYANTFLIPSSAGLGQNSTHISYYSKTNNDVGVDIGSTTFSSTGRLYLYAKISNTFGGRNNNNTASEPSISNLNGLGYYINNRIDASNIKLVKNGITTTSALASTGVDTVQVVIGAVLGLSSIYTYGSKQCAFASIGDGLTDAEALAYYNAVQTFNTTLGRQV